VNLTFSTQSRAPSHTITRKLRPPVLCLLIFAVLLLALFVSACSGSSNETIIIQRTATPTPLATPTLGRTATPTAALTATPTAITASPTPALTATATPVVTATLTPTVRPTPTPTATATSTPAVTATPTSAASPTATATPTSTPTTSVITFSPGVLVLNNPIPGASAASLGSPTPITVDLTAYDSKGNILSPTFANPIHVHVYGAPDGVITPVETTVTSGTAVNLTYSGGFFPNNIELAAWIKDPSGGEALGTTLFIQKNRPPCTHGANTYDVDMLATVPNPIQVNAVVGADNPTTADFADFTIDTGSLGVIVPKKELVMGSNVHGPGAPGQKFYDSSGLIFTGNYYLAPVSVELKDHTFVQTNPILVLGIDGVHCDPLHKGCVPPSKPNLHYLGVGFDRNSTGPGDLFDSPAENAFLELTDAQNGTDINQGYILSVDGVTLGITTVNSTGFSLVTLDPNTTTQGDWEAEPGCYQFATLSGNPQFCGSLLLDVGIDQMFIDLSFDKRPAGSFDSNNRVPSGVGIRILAGDKSSPAMSYDFTAVQLPTAPAGPAPTYVQWVNISSVFVNTGRRPLLSFNYLYSGQCGQVGFEPLK
jgi:hypothetical protein